MNSETIAYLESFLLDGYTDTAYVKYGASADVLQKGVVIVPSSFFADVTEKGRGCPREPVEMLPGSDIPFLFGDPQIEEHGDVILLHADILASAYYMLSRYEEILYPDKRDEHGRYLAKYATVFRHGFGFRPIVDEYGRYLRNLLRRVGVSMPEEMHGIQRVLLTHDVDAPFEIAGRKVLVKEIIKKLLGRNTISQNPVRNYFIKKKDPFYTFPWLVNTDREAAETMCESGIPSEVIYFIIAAKSTRDDIYCDVCSSRFKKLLNQLEKSGASIGLHVGYAAGENAALIRREVRRLPKSVRRGNLKSRHHYLRWTEPAMAIDMIDAGIREDYTLTYADCVGFRCGTCRPYRFIIPETGQLTDLIIHPLEIMEGSLYDPEYMGVEYQEALKICRAIIDQVYEYHGELSLLFHNSSFSKKNYSKKLYVELLRYLITYEPLSEK